MEKITLRTYGEASDVSVYCDALVWYPASSYRSPVLLLSIIGNDSAVKAISGNLLDNSEYDSSVWWEPEEGTKRRLFKQRSDNFKVITSKLGDGVTHQLMADSRFWAPTEAKPDEFLLFHEPDAEISEIVFSRVLKDVPTPLLPEWKQDICETLKANRRLTTFEGIGAAATAVKIDERTLDEIVSAGVREGRMSWVH